jgi:hypothetical protein
MFRARGIDILSLPFQFLKRPSANCWSDYERNGQNLHSKEAAIGNNVNIVADARAVLLALRKINEAR